MKFSACVSLSVCTMWFEMNILCFSYKFYYYYHYFLILGKQDDEWLKTKISITEKRKIIVSKYKFKILSLMVNKIIYTVEIIGKNYTKAFVMANTQSGIHSHT